MSDFYTELDRLMGDDDALSDIRITVRRCWFYDFNGYPIRVWQGRGKLHTSDGNEWYGTIDGSGRDQHVIPAIQDGRDGSSATYRMTLNLVDVPGQTAFEAYEKIKTEQWRVIGRKAVCYLVLFDENEGLRPQTPLSYFTEFTMFNPNFNEKISINNNGKIVKNYSTSVSCKNGNFGRSNVPGGTYADTIQKARAIEWGIPVDKGCEYLALLANRTYQVP